MCALAAYMFMHHVCLVLAESVRGYQLPRNGGTDSGELGPMEEQLVFLFFFFSSRQGLSV